MTPAEVIALAASGDQQEGAEVAADILAALAAHGFRVVGEGHGETRWPASHRRRGMAEHYYVVGKHGPPTKETAPHGFASRRPGYRWTFGYLPVAINVDAEWYPLPAPPTEEAPAPEPVERWVAQRDRGTGGGRLWTRDGAPSLRMIEEVAEDLNTLERDGVVWGPGRPMEELPDGSHPRVLLRADGGPYVAANTYRSTDADRKRLCWWPLPGVAL